MIRITTLAGRRVAVFGLGASGIATAKALVEGGADVVCSDDSAAGVEAAAAAGLKTADLKDANWAVFTVLVLAPGVPLTHPAPHWTVRAARLAGVDVIGDLELFCRERRLQNFDVPLVCITGTNGKSTTTALTAHLLKEAGRDTEVGGNIGTAMLSLGEFKPGRHYVIECSSYQIDLAPSLDASVGVLLNVTPDHLDRHGTIENYAAVKAQLVLGAARAVVGVDDKYCRAIAEKLIATKGADKVLRISARADAECDVGADGGKVVLRQGGATTEIADLAGVGSLRGAHNAENACATAAALLSLPQPLTAAEIAGGMKTFPGLAHRMEELGHQGRTLFVNDSKATNADSTEKALLSFPRDIFWILGGKPKSGGITALTPYFDRVAKAYLIGEATEEFAATLEGKVAFDRCGTLDAATAAAARDAAAASGEPVVLLSPACASFDQYRNFEVRGDAFRALVAALPGISMKRGGA
ncbi:UDP-N-acetylmuramoyl-L-alanine--D-glutamate ligase [Hyphomicrobium sp. xq]|uniref:UDP-N-acetylmuramoylalanine--D-glutamate ligase n=1 Tax=Hyphomicrobium album TaxID=2665159 RepID=A0A6I3KRU6_9HYPH|nr:UDP-N-acetylmuramoyl-L-alanine--D-glutamate ligase [Hyphomicrobium album]MTD95461.1 UDP-N-acetylmuramoyl-L-alanine--D-glutamate ligase [Hyphomicrobium album]